MSKPHKVGNQLAYSVFKISSEDANYPATELANSGTFTKGWQSQRFCSYPQIVLIQFPATVRIKLIQLLCHEYKIPSEIELISITKGGERSKRLGSFKLQDNSSTQYKARELKSVYIESECKYIKLILFKPHPNTKNLFSQVSLLSLSVFGDYIDYEEGDFMGSFKTIDPVKEGVDQSKDQDRSLFTPQVAHDSKMNFSQSSFTSKQTRILNDLLDDKIKALDTEKKKAAQTNDSEKSSKLKKDIDKTMKLAKLAKDLENKKMVAIENEDYDTAKLIKVEIEKIKKSLMSMESLPKVRGTSMSSRNIKTPVSDDQKTAEDITNPGKQMIHSISQIESDLSRITINLEKPDPTKYLNQKYRQVNRTFDQPSRGQIGENYGGAIPAGSISHPQFQPPYIPRRNPPLNNDGIVSEDFPVEAFGDAFDEKIIPMHNKEPIDFSKVKDDSNSKSDAQIGGKVEEEKLNQQDKMKLEILSQYFKEETVKQVLSKNWQIRKVGLESFIGELPKSLKDNGIAVQEHAINIFLSACKEKLPQITELAMNLFEVILEESKKCGVELKFDSNKTASMIAEIIDKKEVRIVKDKILTGGYFEYNTIAAFILSDKSYTNKRLINSEKHIETRLELISFMMETSEKYSSKRAFPMKELLDYVFTKLSHGNKTIRSQTQKVIIQMYHKLGWYALEGYISREVPQNQLQILLDDIPEVESLIKKKEPGKGSESLREALKAVKEATQPSSKTEDKSKPKELDSKLKGKSGNSKNNESKKEEESKKSVNSKNKAEDTKKQIDNKKNEQKKSEKKAEEPKKIENKKPTSTKKK